MDNIKALITEARTLGVEAAENAASWIADGDTSESSIRRALRMMLDGDPEFYNALNWPNLSGEYAGSPTPQSLARDLTGTDFFSEDGAGDDYELMNTLADAYMDGVDSTIESAAEAELLTYLPKDGAS